MRLWSLSFSYLDAKGLVALWRESLLAKAVLENKTRGYKNHPQLYRFKKTHNPIESINGYIYYVWHEANRRGYKFDSTKFFRPREVNTIDVTSGQIKYEFEHLKNKLIKRDVATLLEIEKIINPSPMEIMNIIDGGIEDWEVLKK